MVYRSFDPPAGGKSFGKPTNMKTASISKRWFADALAIISLLAVYGTLFISGAILTAPPKPVCDILAWTAIISAIGAFIIVPKKGDVGWVPLSFLSLAPAVVYLFL